MSKERPKIKFKTVSIPAALVEEINRLIEEKGHWPSRGSFVAEAVREKLRREKEG